MYQIRHCPWHDQQHPRCMGLRPMSQAVPELAAFLLVLFSIRTHTPESGMASALFHSYEKTMRRMFWAEMLDREFRNANRAGFRASLVVNAHTGRPIDVPVPSAPAVARVAPVATAMSKMAPLPVFNRERWSLHSQLQLLRDGAQLAA